MGEGDETGRSEGRIVATITASHVAQHLFTGSSILYPSIKDDLALSYTQIGLMIGVVNILGGFLQMIYSIAGRRVSRRILLGASNLLMSLGCLITGIADRFEALIAGNAISGVGQAGTLPVSSSILGSKYQARGIGSALSIFYGLGYVGNIVSPLLLSSIAASAGWRSAFNLLALIFLVAAVLVFIGLRGEPAAEKAISKGSGRRLVDDIRSALRVRGAVPILVAQAFISGGTGMGVMTTWVPVYLRDASKGLALSVFDAGVVTSVATIGGVLGTIYLGRLADRRGYLRTATLSLATTTTTIFLLTLYQGFNPVLVPHLFILSMTTFSLSSIMQAHLASSAGPGERDILLGLFFTFGFGVSSLWSTLLGALIDSYSFNAVWLAMVGAGIAAQICLLYASRRSPQQCMETAN